MTWVSNKVRRLHKGNFELVWLWSFWNLVSIWILKSELQQITFYGIEVPRQILKIIAFWIRNNLKVDCTFIKALLVQSSRRIFQVILRQQQSLWHLHIKFTSLRNKFDSGFICGINIWFHSNPRKQKIKLWSTLCTSFRDLIFILFCCCVKFDCWFMVKKRDVDDCIFVDWAVSKFSSYQKGKSLIYERGTGLINQKLLSRHWWRNNLL